MFKQLKTKMLLLNLGLFTVLLLVVFTSIYLSMYSEITRRNTFEIERQLQAPLNLNEPHEVEPGPNAMFGFLLVINEGEITHVLSDFNVDTDLANDIYSQIDSIEGTIKIDNYTFQYKKVEGMNDIRIAVIDVTEDTELLQFTLFTYSIIFVVSLAFALLITNFITNRSIKPIKESYEKQKEFIANASHELKTPLTVINTNIDVLLSTDDYKDNKWLHYIKNESERMNKLTQDLLYLAKTGENQEVIQTELNISEKLESILLGMDVLAYENDIKLDYSLEKDISVLFNEEQFTQVAMILLDNAIKYTPKKGKIDVSLSITNKQAYLQVKNTGQGIKEEDLKHIFDRFYKGDKSREEHSNSFGLGLSIAKAILTNNFAKISADSVEGESTTFTIKFSKLV